MTSQLFRKDIILGGPVFSHTPVIKAHAWRWRLAELWPPNLQAWERVPGCRGCR